MILLVIIGIFFAVAGVVSFSLAGTTVNPLKPESHSTLVTSGIYRVTRNPMYVGFMFLLLAWGLYLSNLHSIVFSAGFLFYINRFQIRSEEIILKSSFGRQYDSYRSRVRRWL